MLNHPIAPNQIHTLCALRHPTVGNLQPFETRRYLRTLIVLWCEFAGRRWLLIGTVLCLPWLWEGDRGPFQRWNLQWVLVEVTLPERIPRDTPDSTVRRSQRKEFEMEGHKAKGIILVESGIEVRYKLWESLRWNNLDAESAREFILHRIQSCRGT